MKAIWLLSALAVPCAAQSDVLESTPKPAEPYHVATIDFWGTISEVQATPGRAVGDRFQGSMRLDLRRAPDNLQEGSPFNGFYQWNYLPSCDPVCVPDLGAPHDFVTTRGTPRTRGGFSQDRVIIYDTTGPQGLNDDHIEVTDTEHGPPGGTNPVFEVGVIAASNTVDFLKGGGLLQDFDLGRAEAPGARAYVTEVIDGVWTRFWVVLDRVRMKPRVCRAG
jgi:hypothetical protein